MTRTRWLVVLGIVAGAAWLVAWWSSQRTPAPTITTKPSGDSVAAERESVVEPSSVDGALPQRAERTVSPPRATSMDARTSEPLSDAKARVVVLVVDADGRPIERATVEITGDGPLGEHATNGEGRCTLPIAVGNEHVQLRIRAAGFVSRRVRTGREPELRFDLPRAITVHGRCITASDGAPIAGARIVARLGPGLGYGDLVTSTDASGRFVITGLAERGPTQWRASAEGFASRLVDDPSVLAERECVLELRLGVELSILVVDGLDRSPIAGARIETAAVELATDAEGRITSSELLSADDRHLSITVTHPGYCDLLVARETAAIGSERSLELPLLPGVRLEGRVHGDEGRPIAGAEVGLWRRVGVSSTDRLPTGTVPLPPDCTIRGAFERHAFTDADGRFTFEGLQPWCSTYRLSASSPAHVGSSQAIGELGEPASTHSVDVRLRERGAVGVVTGVVTIDGEARARVTVGWRGVSRQGTGWSDEAGRFRLEDVEVGNVALTPTLPGTTGKCPRLAQDLIVEVLEGRETSVDLAIDADTAPIRGVVLDGLGRPVPRVEVAALADGACWHAYATTDDAGRFELEVDAFVASHRLVAGSGLNSANRDHVAPGSADVELRFPQLASVRVRVVDSATGAPLAAFRLRFRADDGERTELDTHDPSVAQEFHPDARGWRTATLPVGRYAVSVRGSANGSPFDFALGAPVIVDARPGAATAPLEIACERGNRLTLVLAAGEKAWSDDFVVALLEPELWNSLELGDNGWTVAPEAADRGVPAGRLIQFDSTGRAVLERLPRGTLRFKSFRPNLAIEPAELVVPAPSDRPIELSWRRL
ncbi:MAG: carboxypeptidase-like regulatory domain-containing protein [Planctomycetes bacterium]|nr:carboxypeptidase-like regulatory domain-containing protein [Planctomycetota bacterium]